MEEQPDRGPGHVRRRVHPVDVVREVHPPHPIGLEVSLDELAERPGREPDEVGQLVAADRAEPPPRAAAFADLRPPARVEVRRLLEEERLEVAGERMEPSVHAVERRRVGRRDAGRELLHRPLVIRPPRHHAAVLEHGLEPGLARDHPETAALEPQVADHLGPEHRRDVRGRRRATTGRDLLRDAGTPDDVPPLQHDRPQSRAGEVERRGQPVVSAADHDRVVGRHAPLPDADGLMRMPEDSTEWGLASAAVR